MGGLHIISRRQDDARTLLVIGPNYARRARTPFATAMLTVDAAVCALGLDSRRRLSVPGLRFFGRQLGRLCARNNAVTTCGPNMPTCVEYLSACILNTNNCRHVVGRSARSGAGISPVPAGPAKARLLLDPRTGVWG